MDLKDRQDQRMDDVSMQPPSIAVLGARMVMIPAKPIKGAVRSGGRSKREVGLAYEQPCWPATFWRIAWNPSEALSRAMSSAGIGNGKNEASMLLHSC